MKILFDVTLVVLAVSGFGLASFIHRSKKISKPITCPMDGHCDAVVRSDYSKFFGVPVEMFGMFYYGTIAFSYGLFAFYPAFAFTETVFYVMSLTFMAFLFSVYLTYLQAFSIGKWCTWCLISAVICLVIFIVSVWGIVSGSMLAPWEIFEEIYEINSAISLIGLALGFGGSAIFAILFSRFAKDGEISVFEKDTMNMVSQIVMFSLAVFVFSGIGFYFGDLYGYGIASMSATKLTAVLLVVVAEFFLMSSVLPKVSSMELPENKKISHRKAGFLMAMSFVPVFLWLFILIFSVIKS